MQLPWLGWVQKRPRRLGWSRLVPSGGERSLAKLPGRAGRRRRTKSKARLAVEWVRVEPCGPGIKSTKQLKELFLLGSLFLFVWLFFSRIWWKDQYEVLLRGYRRLADEKQLSDTVHATFTADTILDVLTSYVDVPDYKMDQLRAELERHIAAHRLQGKEQSSE
jgi:hypothetical protein